MRTIRRSSWATALGFAVGAAALLSVSCGDDGGSTDAGDDGGRDDTDAGPCIPSCADRTCGLDPECGMPCAPGCGAGQECVGGRCPAGPTWTEATPAAAPGIRSGHTMAYDEARARAVLFSGVGAVGFSDGTWEFDGTTWAEVTPAASPAPRSRHVMAYDAASAHVVLFGGWNTIEALGDTWVFDGTTWTEITSPTSPPPRLGAAMAYDATRGRVVLFGGNDGTTSSSRLGDTWELEGTMWIEAAPVTSPSPRSEHAMTYDPARARIVLFGGEGRAPGGMADTWEYDGATWNEASPGASPTGRALHAMAYDSARGRVVLFSGDDGGRPRDTWEFDGTTWSETTPAVSPTGRRWHAVAYHAARARVLLYGGLGLGDTELGDTWEYGGP